MRRILLLISCLAVLFSTNPVSAKDYRADFAPGSHVRFEHLTIDDGLSQNAGLAFLQDNQGYLWFGTQDGLDRYDGYKIIEYKNDPENQNSLSSNAVISLYQDSEGIIWIGTWGGGLNSLNPQTNEITRYLFDPSMENSLSDSIVTDVYRDQKGYVWIGTQGGLDRLDLSIGEIIHYLNSPDDPKTMSSNSISVISPTKDGKLWVGTGGFNLAGNGLNLFDPTTGEVQRLPKTGECLASSNISKIITQNDGSLWIAYGGYGVPGGGIDHFNPSNGYCKHYEITDNINIQLTDNNITDLVFDHFGTLWATSWSGGLLRLSSSGQFVQINHNPSDPESLSSNSAFSIYEDRSGVIWIGTLGAGINKLNLDTLQFSTYIKDSSNPMSLPSDHVGSFAQTSDGSIWVGIWEFGFARFIPELGTFVQYRNDPDDPESLASDLVATMVGDPDGTLWVGTLGKGLDNFNPQTKKFIHYENVPGDSHSLADNQVSTLFFDNSGRLWIGCFGNLAWFDSKTKTFINYPMSAPAVSFTMVGDELWIGTWGGGLLKLDLSKPANLDPATAEFKSIVNNPNSTNSLSNNGVWSMVKTSDGMVWLGTEGGLNRYDPIQDKFKVYTTKNGLRNATVLGLLVDQQQNIWLLTNNGLARFDPENETFQIFDKSDGLQSNEYNSNAYLQDRNGNFYVGGVGGFTKFDPLKIAQDVNPPDVAITNFSIFNKPQPFDPTGLTPIQLAYNQNFISFEFSAFDYHSPKNNTYAYMLEGFDKDWSVPGTRNYANYTNLPGGDYTFRVKAANSKGVWNDEGISFKLKVIPPIWKTWEFRIWMIIIIGVIIYIALQYRFKSIRNQNTQLQKLVEEQKKVEKELRESEARFKAIFENSAVGMGLMTTDRIVIDSNPAMSVMLGYSRDELVGKSPAMVTYPEDFESSTSSFNRLISGEDNYYIAERRYVKKNGEIIWVQISMSVVRDLTGKPLYLVGLLSNIDDQKRASEKLAAQEEEYRQKLELRIAQRTEELNKANELLRVKAAQDAVIAERTRLARDLHDAVTQTLFSTTLIADVLPEIWEMNHEEGNRRLEEIRQLTRGALAEMRTLLVELRPNALVEVPLPTLLRQLTEALIGRSRMTIQLNTEGERKLPPEVQVSLYRLAQEALNNVVKHAKATQAVVTLRLGETVRLTVEDNGEGFDPSTVTADHLGLKIMRERSEAIGAALKIYSEPGEGTQISVIWP